MYTNFQGKPPFQAMNRQITHKQMTFMMTFPNLHPTEPGTGKILENNMLRVVAVKL